MPRDYQVLNHRGDLQIKIIGDSKKKIFEKAMLAMLKLAGYQAEEKSQITETKIKIKSFDLNSLLVDFLNEILYLIETKKLVFQKIKFKELSDNCLEARLIGKSLKRMDLQIKGVSYHNLAIYQRKDRLWEAIILFDI